MRSPVLFPYTTVSDVQRLNLPESANGRKPGYNSFLQEQHYMDYFELSFEVSGELRDRLIAELGELKAEGFEERDDLLKAFFPENDLDIAAIEKLCADLSIQFEKTRIAKQNWNEVWEQNFEPVNLPGFCTIRASFHAPDPSARFDIVITPKMSFGTGHHATTRLMMQAMKDLPLDGATVLDFGTGTGILAILALKLGARSVMAIDNDSWSVENARENAVNNDAAAIQIRDGSLEILGNPHFDIILANINRHILLQYMADMRAMLREGTYLVVSGIMPEDEAIISESAEKNGLSKRLAVTEGSWLCVIFTA